MVEAAALQDPSTHFQSVVAIYQPYLVACRERIAHDLVDAPYAEYLVSYFERGKMMRPMMVLLSAAATGGDPSRALPAAEAMELLHVAALIHDDLIDNADERRGLPALHKVLDRSIALVLGDYLILKAFEVLSRASVTQAPAGVVSAIQVLSRYAQDCCRGQIQELLHSEERVSEEQYFSITRGKTASQFAAAVTLGAVLGGAGEEEVCRLRIFGTNTGIAFQIRDDELDLTGDSVVLGKPTGNSVAAGRPLLPFIYLAKRASPAAITAFSAFRSGGLSRAEMVRVLTQEGVLERVCIIKERFLSRGLRALGKVRPSTARSALLALAVYAVERNS